MEYNELTTKEIRELETYIDDLEALYDLANEELPNWYDDAEIEQDDIEQFMEWYDEI